MKQRLLPFVIFLLTTSFLLITSNSLAQKQGHIWYFGEGAGLDFNDIGPGGSPAILSTGEIIGYPATSDEFVYAEGSAIISDSGGQLLFYSNGEKVWNRNNVVMPNGDGLMGMYSSTHPAFIVPQPLSDSIFYLFTTDGLERNLEGGLRYSVINMCLANQLGDVEFGQKNILLLDEVSEKLTAVNHQNGKDIWLVAHKYNSDAFYAYQVSENGIIDTVVSNIGSIHAGLGFFSAIGQMKTSPDGNKIGLVFSNVIPAVAELFDFDKATGVLSNPIGLTTNGNEYGLEFSPDNSKVYLSSIGGVFQFDLSAAGGTASAINSSKTQISTFGAIPTGMQLGPDDKIYLSRGSSYVSVIENPNGLGVTCNLIDSALNFAPAVAPVTFPSFIHGYNYRNNVINCNAVASTYAGAETLNTVHTIYQNPIEQSLMLWFDNLAQQSCRLQLFSISGELVMQMDQLRSSTVTISTADLASGLYILRMSNERATLFTDKFAIH